jgi:hypothetical protein
MPAFPRVHIECTLVTGWMTIGRVSVVLPVPLATTCVRAAGGRRIGSTRGRRGAAGSDLCGMHKGSGIGRRGRWRGDGVMGSRARPRRPQPCTRACRRWGGLVHGVCRRGSCGTCTHKTSSRNSSGKIMIIDEKV